MQPCMHALQGKGDSAQQVRLCTADDSAAGPVRGGLAGVLTQVDGADGGGILDVSCAALTQLQVESIR